MATTTNTINRKEFNFDAYNAVMKDANAGLKLFLATQLLGDVASTAARYRNPLLNQLMDLVEEAESLRNEWKAVAAKLQRQTPVGQPAVRQDTPVADANEHQTAIY